MGAIDAALDAVLKKALGVRCVSSGGEIGVTIRTVQTKEIRVQNVVK